jgi:predicted 2-oxoglutarate/Fe(II)-dependent dioxygenase YbiX
MPSVNVFLQCGFLVRRHFLDPGCCRRLIAEMSEAPSARGRLVRDGVDGILDEETRRVGSASVSKATRIRVKQRFLEIVPEVETHFGFPLAGCETPGFLVYDAGAFFAAHRDTGPDDPLDIRSRLVSAIVFLNQPSKEPPGDGYGGGTLRFHGLLDGPEWAACPFPFEPEMGLLVAFRSDVVHEVQAVTCGRRFTVVTWFLAK